MPDIAAARPVSGASIESAWGGQLHDAVEGIQAGYVDVVCAAANTAKTVVFPRAYAAAPVVLVSIDNGIAIHAVGKVQAGGLTPSQFGIIVSSVTNTVLNGTIRAYWLAIGTPA